jgi:hypothetical protein
MPESLALIATAVMALGIFAIAVAAAVALARFGTSQSSEDE